MFDGPFSMVVAIVLIVTVGRIITLRRGYGRDADGNDIALTADPEAQRLRDEVRQLKERVAVLERLATDDSTRLEREIEALRTKDPA